MTASEEASAFLDGPTVSDDVLDNLTDEEKLFLRSTLPTEEEVMIGWATPVLTASPVERRVLVASKIEVLEAFHEDPEGWCARALALAGGGHVDR